MFYILYRKFSDLRSDCVYIKYHPTFHPDFMQSEHSERQHRQPNEHARLQHGARRATSALNRTPARTQHDRWRPHPSARVLHTSARPLAPTPAGRSRGAVAPPWCRDARAQRRLCHAVRRRSVRRVSDHCAARRTDFVRLLRSAAVDVRRHHPDLHGGGAGPLLDHCGETEPGDSVEESLSVRGGRRVSVRQPYASVCDGAAGPDGVRGGSAKSVSGYVSESCLWWSVLLVLPLVQTSYSLTESAAARTSHQQRPVLLLVLLLANSDRPVHVSDHVAGQSEEHEVSAL